MANPKITSTGFVGDLIGTASCAVAVSVQDGTQDIVVNGRTVGTIRTVLQSLADKNEPWLERPYQVGINLLDFVAKWNSDDLDTTVAAGALVQFTPLVGCRTVENGQFGCWLFTSYNSTEEEYVINLYNGNWSKAVKISTGNDLAEIKAQITSASANYASKSHTHTSSQITDLSSSINARLSANVTASNPTLSFGSTSTIGTIAGKNLNVTMPSAPEDSRFFKLTINQVAENSATTNLTGAEIQILATTKEAILEYKMEDEVVYYGPPFGIVSTDGGVAVYFPFMLPYVYACEVSQNAKTATLLPMINSDSNGAASFKIVTIDELEALEQQVTNVSSSVYGVSSSLASHLKYNDRNTNTVDGSTSVVLTPGVITTLTNPKTTVTLTLSDLTSGDVERNLKEAVLRFKTGTTVPTITWPSGVYWANGEAPTIEANTYYECNFGYVVDRWCVAYQTFKEATA